MKFGSLRMFGLSMYERSNVGRDGNQAGVTSLNIPSDLQTLPLRT